MFGLLCIWVTKISYISMCKEYESQRQSITPESGFKITSNESKGKINKVMFVCFLGGIISGMLGLGGGIVTTPLMLELGMTPRSAASTSNFLLIFTSSAGSLLFILSVNI